MKICRHSLLLISAFLVIGLVIETDKVRAQTQQVAKNAVEPMRDVAEPTEPDADKPQVAVPAYSPAASLVRVGVQTAQATPLTLQEAIRKALENNNNIELTRDDVRIQETTIRSQLGFYDPVFSVSPTFTRNSTTGQAATSDFTVGSDITQFIRPGGGNYQVFFNNNRTENAFSQAQLSSGTIGGSSSGATYLSRLGVRYTQPLFRNFRIDNTRRNIKIARRRLEQTDVDFRRQTIEVIAQVQRTYWDLVFALRDQQNRVANLALSQENLRQIEARISAGASAPLARAEVATELANREGDVLLATQQVAVTENTLKQLMLRDATSAEWQQSYLPTDKPAFSLDVVNLDSAVKDAMDNRYELRRLKLQNDINALDIRYFRNQVKPQVDLNSSFSLGGLSQAGTNRGITTDFFTRTQDISLFNAINITRVDAGLPILNTPPPVTIPPQASYLFGGFNRSLANIFRTDAPTYSVGVTISFPFGNRTAKANLAGAEIQKNRLETETRAQEQTVIVEVRNAVQAVETTRQRVLTSRRARENAEIQLEGERKLFDAGKSTTFLLFQRENALTTARNSEIRSETDYNKALADLQRATSTTFELNNITVDSPANDK